MFSSQKIILLIVCDILSMNPFSNTAKRRVAEM